MIVHIQTLADKWGVHPKTVRRRIQAQGGQVRRGYASLPDVAEFATQDGEPNTTLHAPTPKQRSISVVTDATAPRKAQKAPRISTQIFQNHQVAILGAMVLISCDALSFGWIAWNAYHDFQTAAAAIFALAGFAVGYSAIKNIITYTGWNGDGWAWGFGLFQLCLHLCAMEVFGPYSFTAGKVIIAAGLPLAVGGLATSMRDKK